MPRAGISVQHTACTRRAARRRVLARSFCAHFPLRASLAPSAPALASHGVLLTLQVESCTSPWLCTLLRLFLLSLSISAVRHPHKCRPSQIIVMQHHTARPRATEAGRRAAARMANPSKNRKYNNPSFGTSSRCFWQLGVRFVGKCNGRGETGGPLLARVRSQSWDRCERCPEGRG